MFQNEIETLFMVEYHSENQFYINFLEVTYKNVVYM